MNKKFLISLLAIFLSGIVSADIRQAQTEIISRIKSSQTQSAVAAIDKLINDYSHDSELQGALFEIGENFGWSNKCEEEKQVYQRIIQKYPGSPIAAKAGLGYLKADVIISIGSRNFDEATKNTDKLLTDFKGHPDLPDAVYRIARTYGWSNKYDEEKVLYQRLIQEYPNSAKAGNARLGYVRAQINSFVISQKSQEAKTAYSKLVENFSSYPDFHETLNSIAKRWTWAGNYQEAQKVYQKVVQQYPGSSYAAKAQANIQVADRGIELFSLIDANKKQNVPAKIEQLIKDFNDNELLAQTVILCGERYSARAFQKSDEAQSKEDLKTAIDIWKRIIKDLPASTTTAYAYYQSAICYERLGQYQKAGEYFKKIVDDYPDFEMAWDAQFRTGHTYEQMFNAGLISRSQAEPLVASAYKKVLEKYPDCKAVVLAKKWLEINGN